MSWCIQTSWGISRSYLASPRLRPLPSDCRTTTSLVRAAFSRQGPTASAVVEKQKMFRHVVLLTVSEDADVERIVRELNGLTKVIPELLSYSAGRDAGMAAGNANIAVVADFLSVDDYVKYRDNAEHQRIIAELIKPFAKGRTAVQYEIPADKVQGGAEGTK